MCSAVCQVISRNLTYVCMASFLANGKNIPNRDDDKTFQTEGLKKAAMYWPQGRCGKKAALCPWLPTVNNIILSRNRYDSCFKTIENVKKQS